MLVICNSQQSFATVYSIHVYEKKQKRVKYLLKSYYREKVIYSKLRFSKFKKFFSRSVFGQLQLTQISLNLPTFCCTLKIWEQKGACFFHFFNMERNYEVSKSPFFLLNKNINYNKNKKNRKKKIPSHFQRDKSNASVNIKLLN